MCVVDCEKKIKKTVYLILKKTRNLRMKAYLQDKTNGVDIIG